MDPWIDITARDAERSRAFYSALLGWEFRVDPASGYGVITSATGGLGEAREGYPHPPGIVPYLPVDDLDAALERAATLGATRVVAPWEVPGLGRMAVVLDPDGNRLGLWQR